MFPLFVLAFTDAFIRELTLTRVVVYVTFLTVAATLRVTYTDEAEWVFVQVFSELFVALSKNPLFLINSICLYVIELGPLS